MTAFKYQALNGDGATVDGQIEADGFRQAQRMLRKRGLTPISLQEAKSTIRARKQKRVSSRQARILLLRELGVLIEAGVPLAEAISSLAASRGEADLQAALEGISRDLRQGLSLSLGMRKHLAFLPGYVHQLIEAGELTGQLKSALKDATAQMEYEERVATEIRGALVYPLFLLGSGLAAVLFIFIFVVPRFSEMFKEHRDQLPTVSRYVMSTGLFVRDNVFYLALALIAVILIIINLARRPAVREWFQAFLMRLPVVGPWLLESETARWTNMLSTLLVNKIPLLKALELARISLNAPELRIRLTQVERAVRGGTALSNALEEYCEFQTAILNLIRAGERAGNLSQMLKMAATMTEESVRQRMKQTISLIEPAAILIVGAMVGLIVISIILAITSLNQINL
jgi:general secretion pathway protein F